MSSIIIKVTQFGSSREYLFNKLGPITIGSDKRCDLFLDDPQIEPKLLEVKISGGNIFVKEIGSRAEIYLNSVILPFREETRYHEGECISLQNTNYQIHIKKAEKEAHEPPPFFEGEFKERLDRMNLKIQEREIELKALAADEDKKKGQISELEERVHRHASEKGKLEIEVENLKLHRDNISQEVRKKTSQNLDEEEKVKELREFVKRLEVEERGLKETIVAQTMVLRNLKDDREKKSKEVDSQRILLASLHLDTTRMEDELKSLNDEYVNQEQEILEENGKIQSILNNSEAAMKEGARIREHLTLVIKEKTLLDHEVKDLQEDLAKHEVQRKESQNKLNDLRSHLSKEEANYRKIQEEILKQNDQEVSLKSLNAELRAEMMKAEEKLSLKKNQLNQMDFQNQDASRRLSTVHFEIERASVHLRELESEEKAQELKMLSLREDLSQLNKKASEDKKHILKLADEEKRKVDQELVVVKSRLEDESKSFAQVEADRIKTQGILEEMSNKHRSLLKEKSALEGQVNSLASQKQIIEEEIKDLRMEAQKVQFEKDRTYRELSTLQLKLLDTETEIKERLEAAQLEMESFKNHERSKIVAEKEVYLSEVEAFKQKSLIEVEAEYRRKQDSLYEMKQAAHKETEAILKTARDTEAQITGEADGRLKVATQEADLREKSSHQRVKEAEAYFKQRETEAELLLNKSRLEARDMVKRAEQELLEDLGKRKQKIKKFLTMKQEAGLSHMKVMTDQHIAKLKRDEGKAQSRLEDTKRKELKRIAKIREEELTHQAMLKDSVMKEAKLEKEKNFRLVQELKVSQEAELADKKKAVLEHINQQKYRHQQTWEAELKKEKMLFENSKKERIANAAQAVMNVLVADIALEPQTEQKIKDRVLSTLTMAIDGQNATAMKEADLVLDFNPQKRKKIGPVIQKYSLRFGLPAAIAIILVADIGSVRSNIVAFAKDTMKQRESASEKYVTQQKTEWKEKHSFNPEQTIGYKASFTDNVLYTKDFDKIMDNEAFQNEWILKVHDFMVKDLELSEDIAISYISAEGTVIKELMSAKKDLHPQFLDQGMKKLTDLENTHMGWLSEKVADPLKLEKFSAFRKEYFDNYAKNQVIELNRDVATEVKENP